MAKPLTVGIDVRELRTAKTGIKTILEEICREFKTMESPDLHFHFLDTSMPIYTGNNKLMKLGEHIKYQLWKQVILPFKAWSKKCDIVFCADTVPYLHLGYKTIPIIHDAFCFESPQHYGKLWLWIYKKTATPGARRSPFVVTATAYARDQISHYMSIPANRFVIIHDGPKRLNYVEDNDKTYTTLASLSLTPSKYILHVGSMYKRKNLPALVNAFSKLKKTGYADLKLVLAGSFITNKFDNDYDLILNIIETNNLQSEVIITGYLSDGELNQLYKNALLYVFPSINEGFGLPVLEAFAYNLPVLISSSTSLPEVGGDAALQFDGFNVDDIAAKIKTVLDDAALQKEMIIKGQERLKLFSWHNTATKLIDVFKRAL
jgi:glycosyltransferase involved in cell wall biosynthesis